MTLLSKSRIISLLVASYASVTALTFVYPEYTELNKYTLHPNSQGKKIDSTNTLLLVIRGVRLSVRDAFRKLIHDP